MGRFPLQAVPENTLKSRTHGREQLDYKQFSDWRRQWQQIMAAARIYFYNTEPPEGVKESLLSLGAQIRPFFDNKVTHIITAKAGEENAEQTVVARAKELHIKIWTFEKLKRFLTYLLGHSPSKTESARPNLLPNLISKDRLCGTGDREEMTTFEHPYLLVTDYADHHKPLLVKEWPEEVPQFRATPVGSCPFVPVASLKRRRDQRDQRRRALEPAIKRPSRSLEQSLQVVHESPKATENGTVCSSEHPRAPRTDTRATIAQAGLRFAEIVASGVQRCSTTSATKSAVQSGDVLELTRQSREVASLQRKALPPPAQPQVQKTAPSRPGFCENCLERFDNFDHHILSRNHRRYAMANKHFAQLDAVLAQVQRKPRALDI